MNRLPAFLRPLTASLLALGLLARPAEASVSAGHCGSTGINPWACITVDYDELAAACDRVCPNWTFMICYDLSLHCYDMEN